NPLAAIRMATQSLQKSEFMPREHALRTIDSSSRRMARMIDQLLDFTRLRLGTGLIIVPRDIDLENVASDVVAEIRAAHPRRTVHCHATGDCRGTWDPSGLGQVLSNLITNALVHGRQDTPVDVSIMGAPEEMRFSVHNEGDPIDPNSVASLFDPFRRG